jgi:hypothetical protein
VDWEKPWEPVSVPRIEPGTSTIQDRSLENILHLCPHVKTLVKYVRRFLEVHLHAHGITCTCQFLPTIKRPIFPCILYAIFIAPYRFHYIRNMNEMDRNHTELPRVIVPFLLTDIQLQNAETQLSPLVPLETCELVHTVTTFILRLQPTWSRGNTKWHTYFFTRESAVGIATGYGLDGRGVAVRVPVGAIYSLLHVFQTGSGAHPAFYTVGTGGSFAGGIAAGAWSWPLTFI